MYYSCCQGKKPTWRQFLTIETFEASHPWSRQRGVVRRILFSGIVNNHVLVLSYGRRLIQPNSLGYRTPPSFCNMIIALSLVKMSRMNSGIVFQDSQSQTNMFAAWKKQDHQRVVVEPSKEPSKLPLLPVCAPLLSNPRGFRLEPRASCPACPGHLPAMQRGNQCRQGRRQHRTEPPQSGSP